MYIYIYLYPSDSSIWAIPGASLWKSGLIASGVKSLGPKPTYNNNYENNNSYKNNYNKM